MLVIVNQIYGNTQSAIRSCLLALCTMNGLTCFGDDSVTERVTALVNPYIANERVMGMTVGVLQNGTTWVKGYGRFAEKDARVPDGQTMYEIGSVTKTFTGILLADAVVRGRMQLDDAAEKYLPDGAGMPSKGESPITLKHLATHASGLPRIPENMVLENTDDPYANYSVDQMLEFLSNYKLRRRPVMQISYSNLGFGLLGWLVARDAQTDYESLLRDRITGPLKMNDSLVKLSPSLEQRMATPYAADGIKTVPWHIESLAGLGGIHSTVDDMLRYIQANLEPPDSELGKAIELAWQVHQPPLIKTDFAMGLGWHVARDGHTRWHSGQTAGFHACLYIDRRSKLGFVLLANTASFEIDALGESIVRMLMGIKSEPREFERVVEVSTEAMQRYVGKFELAPNVVFTININDGKLMVGLTGQPTCRVFPRSETEWFYRVVEATLTFKIDEDGRCDTVELFQNGIRQKAKRIQ